MTSATRRAIFARLPRVGALNASARPIARELVEWRERTAAAPDRPVQSVSGDATLVEIARRRPSSRAELQKIRGAGASGAGRRAEDLLDAVQRGRARPPDPPPAQARRPRPSPTTLRWWRWPRRCCARVPARRGSLYELLAARADLQAIVALRARANGAEADVRTLRGSRRELVGAELLELLHGGVSLSVHETGRGRRVRINRA